MTKGVSKSYTYIAAGQVNGIQLMKVGKTNDLRRRSRQIGLPIEISTASLTEAGAFRLETELREFVVAQGGVRHRNTLDWFAFDARIYALLCEHFIVQPASDVWESLSPDEEIALYRRRYIQLLEEEFRRERDTALAQLQDAMFENERLRKELKEQCLEIRELEREMGRLENKITTLKDALQNLKDDNED